MKLSQFDYVLPNELIATHPVEPRDHAKLLVFDQENGKYQNLHFFDLPDLLGSNDVLVFNDSKVIPARLFGTLDVSTSVIPGGKPGIFPPTRFEVLLAKHKNDAIWECWVKNGKKLKIDDKLIFSDKLSAKYLKRENEMFYLNFNLDDTEFFAEIEKIGEMPIPPYIVKARSLEIQNSAMKHHEIKVKKNDIKNYQTVYCKPEGSVAAPTAGLHFTEELLEKLRKKGVQTEFVTLHVGLGTFQPVNTEDIEDFQIHSEYYSIAPDTAERLNQAKKAGKRIIAVGTTSVRVLESAADSKFEIQNSKLSDDTCIYIYPGYKFRFIDGMITNFHLPKSSLLLLVSAFSGKENIRKLYQHAIKNKYRFYSYGDGMLLL